MRSLGAAGELDSGKGAPFPGNRRMWRQLTV